MSFQDRPYYIPLPMNSSLFLEGAGIEGMVWDSRCAKYMQLASMFRPSLPAWGLEQILQQYQGEHCFLGLTTTTQKRTSNSYIAWFFILYIVFSCCLLSFEAFFHSCSLTQSICKLVFWKVNTRWWPPFVQIHSNGFHAGISTIEVVIQLWITASMRTWTTINLSNQNH